jgi:hypothetical protein
LHLAKALGGLLSAQPGSVICGDQVGARERGIVTDDSFSAELFSHSPQTWSSLWDGEVFKKGSVKVETELFEIMARERSLLMMRWSVTRL